MMLELIESKTIAPGIMTFRFKVEKWVDFLPGQYAMVTLDAPGDLRKGIRLLSISSSPTETGHLRFTTKISQSPFKQKLASMKIGDMADIKWPLGRFTLDYSKPAMMISGGIGITPLRSMIRYATDKKLPLRITLIYSCATQDGIVYREELLQMEKENPSLKLVFTLTEPQEEWHGRTGRIDENLLKEFLMAGAIIYICGPPAMVSDLRAAAESAGVKKEDIRSEEFTGY